MPTINNQNIYLTFDLDWAVDEVFEYLIDIIEKEAVCATFFITHETELLERIRKNKKIELGIHPNFNNLLDNPSSKQNAKEILDNSRCA